MTERSSSSARGRFIALEGIDGAGKSSQIEPLVAWLRDRGHGVVTCRDPGSTAVGDAIRGILLHRHDIHPSAMAEMLLYMAARAQLAAEVIGPALARGDWVVSDRYLLANVVYQGHAGGLDPELIRRIGEAATGGIHPDLVLVLDLDLDTAARRLSRPLDKLENRGEAFRRLLRDGYRAEAARDPGRIRIVNAAAGIAEVGALLRASVAAHLGVAP